MVAHLTVQMFVLLFDCLTVFQEWNRQEIVCAQSEVSKEGQNQAFARFAHFLPFHVTRHQAIRYDDCNHCPDDWKHQTELARVHLEALLVDCDDFLSQAQEETEEVMSLVITSVPVPNSCLLLLGYPGAPLVTCQHLMEEFPHVPHLCKLYVLGTLETQLSCHPAIDSESPNLETLP